MSYLTPQWLKLESLVKKFKQLDKEYWKLYKIRRNKYPYTSMLIKTHPERLERKEWERKNNFKQIEHDYYNTKRKIEDLRRKLNYTSKVSYIKLGKNQKKLISFLRDHKTTWYSIKEIALNLKISESSVRTSIKTPLERKFIIIKKSGKSKLYKISNKGLEFHVDNRPLKAYDRMFLDFIAENQPISITRAKNHWSYKEDSLKLLKFQKFILVRNGMIRLTRKGKINYNSSNL